MNLVKTQNFYNLMNSYKNKDYDSGVPSEFSNAPNVDHGRNLITMKTGTYSNSGGVYTPSSSGVQKIIQCGRYGFITPPSTPNKIHFYDSSLTSPIQRTCDGARYGSPLTFMQPRMGGDPFRDIEGYLSYWGLSVLLSDDDTPVTLQTTTDEGHCLALYSVSSGSATLTLNGFSYTLYVSGNTSGFTAKKLLVCMGSQWYAPTCPPVILAGAVLDEPITVASGGQFDFFIGNEFIYE